MKGACRLHKLQLLSLLWSFALRPQHQVVTAASSCAQNDLLLCRMSVDNFCRGKEEPEQRSL
jgi:hypothetical protein